jgi:RNA polymerase sigma-70 factor, ECF subfamily
MSAAPTFCESAASDEAAQAGLLYERYARQLQGFCRARLSSREEAEDAVQHTFLNAYRSLRSGTRPRAEAAWMFAIAANVCRERRRSAWRRSRIEVVSDDGLVGECAAPERSHEELTGVADALAELTPNQRRAILMREWQGLSYREIAGELSLSEGAVETLLFRARRSLADKLDRSRGRVWGISNLGSVLAWGKSLLGGTAAQVAAATLVVGAGVTAASPVVRHDRAATTPVRAAQVRQAPATPKPVPSTSHPGRRATKPHQSARQKLQRAQPGTDTGTDTGTPAGTGTGGETLPAPAPVSAPTPVAEPAPPPPPMSAPAPPSLPQIPALPKVEAPALPPVPPLPPLPPVNVPSVPVPDLPPLPKLP